MRGKQKLSICLAVLLVLQGALPACIGEEMPVPTQAATEAPTEVPTEAPTQAPTEIPAEIPAEAPTERPTEAPAETPAGVQTEAPAETPTEAPTETPIETPIETPTPSLELCVDERYLSEGLSIGAAGETARFIGSCGEAAHQAAS